MNTILVTAYAVNPNKGSEDAMGWNFIMQIARHNNVVAVTRKNNRPAIEQFFQQNNIPQQERIRFRYFDWPQWMICWKKGPTLSLIYYYLWQISLVCWLFPRRHEYTITHNLNFHNDWTPSFLWILGKPMVWGPVGHHPKIPKEFLLTQYGFAAYCKERFTWLLKLFFWNLDPFLYLSRKNAALIYCMNQEAVKKLRLKKKYIVHPSVASETPLVQTVNKTQFRILSVGRFVPMKGFDITLRSFAAFFHQLPVNEQAGVQLVLVGTGPLKAYLVQLCRQLNIHNNTNIIEWLPRNELTAIYNEASVFLFPSHEGAGMVVPEAMSYGLPVVCLRNCGPGELVSPQSDLCCAYEAYDVTVHAVAGKLKKLYTDQTFYQAESRLAADRYQQLFRWEVRGDLLKNIYAALAPVHTVEQTEINATEANICSAYAQ